MKTGRSVAPEEDSAFCQAHIRALQQYHGATRNRLASGAIRIRTGLFSPDKPPPLDYLPSLSILLCAFLLLHHPLSHLQCSQFSLCDRGHRNKANILSACNNGTLMPFLIWKGVLRFRLIYSVISRSLTNLRTVGGGG